MSPITDPIGDLLTRMRNAQSARKKGCQAPWSKLKEGLCTLLKDEGFLADVEVEGEGKERRITVTFSKEHPSLELKRVSRPGRRVYEKASTLKPVLRGYGLGVVSTSAGLMTDREARKQGKGGELLCTVV